MFLQTRLSQLFPVVIKFQTSLLLFFPPLNQVVTSRYVTVAVDHCRVEGSSVCDLHPNFLCSFLFFISTMTHCDPGLTLSFFIRNKMKVLGRRCCWQLYSSSKQVTAMQNKNLRLSCKILTFLENSPPDIFTFEMNWSGLVGV